MNILAGQVINGYEIHEHIGSGAHGAVYKAYHSATAREVALKVLLPENLSDSNLVQRFEIESEVISKLKHPYIIPLYEYWRDDERLYMVMCWLGGGSLRDRIKKAPLSLEQTAKMLDQVAAALATAHEANIIHRDIKPDNILFDDDENAYISDFGIAKRLNYQSITGPDAMVGSPAYLSPEQIMKADISPRTDIYQLGITLYEALIGHHPYEHAPSYLQLVMCHLQETPLSMHGENPNIPESVDEVIQIATAKKSEDRYPTAQAMAEAFRAAI